MFELNQEFLPATNYSLQSRNQHNDIVMSDLPRLSHLSVFYPNLGFDFPRSSLLNRNILENRAAMIQYSKVRLFFRFI